MRYRREADGDESASFLFQKMNKGGASKRKASIPFSEYIPKEFDKYPIFFRINKDFFHSMCLKFFVCL